MPYKLLIVDDNQEIRRILSDYFATSDEIEVCGTAENGMQALTMLDILKPDVILMDIIMPVLDGIGFLERFNLKYRPGTQGRPKIIVVSAIGHEIITKKAFNLHADYFIMKPFDFGSLRDIIVGICVDQDEQPVVIGRTGDVCKSIIELLAFLEVNVSNFGYKYIKICLSEMLNPESRILTTKEMFGSIAKDFTTTVECVEKAIRNSIRAAFMKNPSPFKELGFKDGNPPSVSRFLSASAEYLRS